MIGYDLIRYPARLLPEPSFRPAATPILQHLHLHRSRARHSSPDTRSVRTADTGRTGNGCRAGSGGNPGSPRRVRHASSQTHLQPAQCHNHHAGAYRGVRHPCAEKKELTPSLFFLIDPDKKKYLNPFLKCTKRILLLCSEGT